MGPGRWENDMAESGTRSPRAARRGRRGAPTPSGVHATVEPDRAPPGRRRSRRRVLATVLVALALVAAGVGCGSGSDEAANGSPDTEAGGPPPQPGGQLVVAVPVLEPETALRLTLEPLTTFAADGSVAPYLAESVEPNETFDRWTIRVRPGIEFHNGEALDADAVKANLDTYSVSELYSTDPFAPVVSTTVVDDLTVEVELAQPWASFPAPLTAEQSDGTGLMVAPESVEKLGSLFLANPGVDDLYGTGPFILDEADPAADTWTARKNPSYWQEGLPYVDEVEIQAVLEGSSRLAGVTSGELDVTLSSDPPDDPGDLRVISQEGELQVLAVALNTRQPPFDDPDLREAMALATDVEALAETAGIDPALLASGPFRPGSPWADGSERPPFDPDRARQLVADVEEANGPVSIRLGAQELEVENVAVQQALADQWRDVGVDVELSVVNPFMQTATLLVAGDFDAVLGRVFGLPDPDLYYFWWHSSALRTEDKPVGYNYVGIDDPALDEALDEVRATPDEEQRQDALRTVQERLAETQPYLWLWATRWSAVANQRVHGLGDAPLPDGGTRMALVGPRLDLEAVWIER